MISHRLAEFTLLLALIFVGGLPVYAADSLLLNGDLEKSSATPDVPAHWPAPKDDSGLSYPTENGNRFLRLKSPAPGKLTLVFLPVKLPAGTGAVELSWHQRVTDLKIGKQSWFDARIMVEFVDAAGKKFSPQPSAPNTRKNTEGWVQRTATFLVPEGARELQLMPTLFQVESGTFDLDNLAVRPIDPAPLREAAAAAQREREAKLAQAVTKQQKQAAATLTKYGSLIANGNFETVGKQPDWPDHWGRPKADGSWERESENHFIRLVSPGPGQTTMLYRLVELPADVQALELTWRWRISNLKPGKEPWYDARIMLEFKDAGGKSLPSKPSPPYTRQNTEGWVARSTKFLVPDKAVTLEFMPALFHVERGTLELDDITLRPTDAADLIAAREKAAVEAHRAAVPLEAPRRGAWPAELHVAGNKLLDPRKQPVWLQGVNVVSLEFLVQGDHVLKSIQVAVDDWKSNVIRLPVKEEYWFGKAAGQKDGGAAYRELVDAAITMAANRGAYTVLDLHRFHAPRNEHVEFWKDAATRYRNHPAVLFDLFNEPHGVSWQVWRDGGFVAEKKKPTDEDGSAADAAREQAGFDSVGMQKLIDTVRATGAKNVVICGGLDWAYDLSGVANGFELKDAAGNGLMYATHIYPWKRGWQEKVLVVADKYPILVGEVGAGAEKMPFIPAAAQEDAATWVPDMLGLIQQHKLHWTAFSFHPKASPVIISDWDYTPTPAWGVFVKKALAGESFPLRKLR